MDESNFDITDEQNNKKKRNSNLKTILTVLAFVGPIAATVAFGNAGNSSAACFCFGLFFILMFIIGTWKTKIKITQAWLLSFPAIGVLMSGISGLYMWGGDGVRAKMKEMAPNSMLYLFLLVGLVLIIAPTSREIYKKVVCTELITATCIDSRKTRHDSTRPVYSPIYKFYYNGTEYTACDDIFNFSHPPINENHQIHINPNKPQLIYRPNTGYVILLVVIGVFFVVIGTIMLSWMP